MVYKQIVGGKIVKYSYRVGLAVSSLLLATSGAALAADIAKGPYAANGVYTASTCGSISPALKKGAPTTSQVEYPGAGKPGMILASPATAATGKPGSAATSVCVATTAVPAKGLDGAALTFNCFTDTAAGPAKKPSAQLKATFNVGASHSAAIKQVTVSGTLIITKTLSCKLTTDGTYSLE
jgi:hypothetical protein